MCHGERGSCLKCKAAAYEFSFLTGVIPQKIEERLAKLRDECDIPGIFTEINLPRRQEVMCRCGQTNTFDEY